MSLGVGTPAARLLRHTRAVALALPLACALLLLSAPPAYAQQQASAPLPVITWAVMDTPPAYILPNGAAPANAAELGNGVMDRMLQELTARLPQYRHEFRLANYRRLWATLRQGDNICAVNMLKTREREQLTHMTPAMLMPPIALVVRAGDRQQFTRGAPSVSLRELLGRELRGGLEAGRSYGPALDAVLALAETAPLPGAVNGTAASPASATTASGNASANSGSGAMLNLLALGRYDYTLEYPMTVQHAQQTRPLSVPLAVLPLREAQDWNVGHIACTRNAWGKAVLRDIDDALRAAFRSPAYREILAAWLPPAYYKANQQRIAAFYDSRPPSPALARANGSGNGRNGDAP